MKQLSLLAILMAFVLAGVSTTGVYAAGDAKEQNNGDFEEHYYVELDTITVTLFNEDSVVGLYIVAAKLEIAEAGQRSLVLDARSRLRDAMIVELHALVARRKGISIPLDAVNF